LLVLALTPAATHNPDVRVILLGYVVDFMLTWTLMAAIIGLIMRLISKGKLPA
jgi:hypothetical protein